jgi:hypothetical protein
VREARVREDGHVVPPMTDAEVDLFRVDGFVVLRAAFDPDRLAREFDDALARGFARSGPVNVSAEASISFRYLPTMSGLTPVGLGLLGGLRPLAAQALGREVLPVRAKAVEYHGASSLHRDSESTLPSVGFLCYLEPLDGDTGALHVVPRSHRRGDGEASARAVETAPGDVIVLDEHLLHGSERGGVRRQWRSDYVAWPSGDEEHGLARAYFGAIFSPDWDAGYDVDAFPTYGGHWRRVCDPATDRALDGLGAYAAAAAEEDAARRRGRSQPRPAVAPEEDRG